ncbi:MAG: hypothetical protein PHO60_05145 [Methanothrix sp.]|jgi:hypothetical protein|nr:hypothetical protein [Methanothrix sp.]MDI9398874.1 hypothetical protein [Euryarchaeota archaeon]
MKNVNPRKAFTGRIAGARITEQISTEVMLAEPKIAATRDKSAIPVRERGMKRKILPTNEAYSSFGSEFSVATSVDIVSASLINSIQFKSNW